MKRLSTLLVALLLLASCTKRTTGSKEQSTDSTFTTVAADTIEQEIGSTACVPPPPPPPPIVSVSDTSFDKVTPGITKSKKKGLLVYDIPDTLEYRVWYTVRFRIVNKNDTATAISGLRNVSVQGTTVSSVMEVKITDPHQAFQIVKNNSDIQEVDDDEFTEWVYDIFPIKGGLHPLNIVVSTVTGKLRKDIVHISVVYVRVKLAKKVKYETSTFFGKYWQWMCTTIIIPFIVWWWNKRRKKETI